MKLFSGFTLGKAYQKGFRQGSKFWKFSFVVVLLAKVIKHLSSKPKPETFAQYDLEPGEYRIVVKENKKK